MQKYQKILDQLNLMREIRSTDRAARQSRHHAEHFEAVNVVGLRQRCFARAHVALDDVARADGADVKLPLFARLLRLFSNRMYNVNDNL